VSASEFVPAPISNPGHSGREARTVQCLNCDRDFHPWHGSRAKYCTRRCAGRGRSRRLPTGRRRVEVVRDPRGLGTPNEELARFLRRNETGDLYGSPEED
jgi:hypothetical protein